MIKALLFDFYGVFIPDSYGVWLKKNELKREGIFAELINMRDRGGITEPAFLAELSRLLGREVAADEIHIHDPQPDQELIEIIKELKPRYRIGLFSNASNKLRGKLESLGITDLFDEIIISSEIGHAKPSDEAFMTAIRRMNVASNEILFVDDNSKNFEAALRNDMRACLYASIDSFHEAMQVLESDKKD